MMIMTAAVELMMITSFSDLQWIVWYNNMTSNSKNNDGNKNSNDNDINDSMCRYTGSVIEMSSCSFLGTVIVNWNC